MRSTLGVARERDRGHERYGRRLDAEDSPAEIDRLPTGGDRLFRFEVSESSLRTNGERYFAPGTETAGDGRRHGGATRMCHEPQIVASGSNEVRPCLRFDNLH